MSEAAATIVQERGAAPPLLQAPDVSGLGRERLAPYLAAQGFSFDPGQPVRQFAGGLANRNYLIEIDGGLAVLRRPPDGELPPGAHDMAREHRILSRLADALPFVPRGLHYCADPAVIGAPFQIIEYRPGLVLRGSDLSPVADRPEAPARLSAMLVETLAAIHAVEAEAVGLGDLGRPAGFLERGIAGWTKRGLLVTDGSPLASVVGEVSGWLGRERFSERAPTLLHCDFKLDNCILDPETLAPAAVVDWDMGTRGDPLFDLATMLSYWAEPTDPPCLLGLDQMPTAKPGFWSRSEAARRYGELTGTALDDLHPMRVLAMLKLGVVFLQLNRQWVTGAVKDPRYARFRQVGEDLVLLARDVAKGDAR